LIIVYGGKYGKRNEASKTAVKMKQYLVNTRGVDSKQVKAIDGGYRENFSYELWVIPNGAVETPKPTPTVLSKDVKLKGSVKFQKKN